MGVEWVRRPPPTLAQDEEKDEDKCGAIPGARYDNDHGGSGGSRSGWWWGKREDSSKSLQLR